MARTRNSLVVLAMAVSLASAGNLAARAESSATIYEVIQREGKQCYMDHGIACPLPGAGIAGDTVKIITADSGEQWYMDRDGNKTSLPPAGSSKANVSNGSDVSTSLPSGWEEVGSTNTLKTAPNPVSRRMRSDNQDDQVIINGPSTMTITTESPYPVYAVPNYGYNAFGVQPYYGAINGYGTINGYSTFNGYNAGLPLGYSTLGVPYYGGLRRWSSPYYGGYGYNGYGYGRGTSLNFNFGR